MSTVRGTGVAALAAWFCLLSSNAFAQVGESSDSTAVASTDIDPIGAFGSRPVLFTARAVETGAQLRSGPDRAYPVVESLTPHAILLVVGDRNDFLEVLVPSGFHAFVKRDYVEAGSDGVGIVRGASVNLRSRPTLEGDYPIGQLQSGTSVWIVGAAGEDDSWLEVVAPTEMPLWVPDDAVEIAGDLAEPAIRASIEEALDARRRNWIENSPEARIAAAQRAHEAELEGELKLATEEVRRQRELGADADFTAARAMLGKIVQESVTPGLRDSAQQLIADLDSDERRAARDRENRAAAERLKQELEHEKIRLAQAERKAAEDAAKYSVGPKRALGDRESVTGFLRSRGDGKTFAIERGNSIAVLVQTSNQRYRLADFVGRQVEISGRYVVGGNPPTIEIERLMIFRR